MVKFRDRVGILYGTIRGSGKRWPQHKETAILRVLDKHPLPESSTNSHSDEGGIPDWLLAALMVTLHRLMWTQFKEEKTVAIINVRCPGNGSLNAGK